MAPIRRYLRITKYSVLEVRIYLDDPSLAQSWLLNPRFNVLSRITQAVRPLVLPKLREESERATKGKGGGKAKKAKGVKDVVYDHDFEVSIFLTDVPTRHSLLTKQKEFKDKGKQIRSNSGKLTGWVTAGSTDQPINVDSEYDDDEDSVVIRQESEEEDGGKIGPIGGNLDGTDQRRGKRRREDSNDDLFINDELSEEEGLRRPPKPTSKRDGVGESAVEAEDDDKKKLGMKTSYDGFSIYGRVLCLVVKRKGSKSRTPANDEASQQMLENWVSTQAAQEQTMLDDE